MIPSVSGLALQKLMFLMYWVFTEDTDRADVFHQGLIQTS